MTQGLNTFPQKINFTLISTFYSTTEQLNFIMLWCQNFITFINIENKLWAKFYQFTNIQIIIIQKYLRTFTQSGFHLSYNIENCLISEKNEFEHVPSWRKPFEFIHALCFTLVSFKFLFTHHIEWFHFGSLDK